MLTVCQSAQQCQQMHRRPEMRLYIFIAHLFYRLTGLYRGFPSMSIGNFVLLTNFLFLNIDMIY